MKELKPRITEKGIDYVLIGDYYYPNLEFPKDEDPHYGKYGSMRLNYIKKHKKGLYSSLRMEGRLISHLNEIDDAANEQMEILVQQLMKHQGITENLKSEDWLGWVRAVNNIRNAAEEIVCNELIYQ
ncbi:MAG: TnpV protein [Lachnospiraceae bacterium]